MKNSGFTLIELSIVLVIIGLIIGGILTGQDLITSAGERAQIAQIEKYNTAARTFQSKYGYLPGDIPNPYATQFGFIARGALRGLGDGNGVVESGSVIYGNEIGSIQTGEIATFWVDLSTAGLIDGSFSTATMSASYTASGAALNNYFPQGKIGNGNYITIDSGGYYGNDNANYYTLQPITSMSTSMLTTTPGLSIRQAYNIDKKADDGLPQSGNILAVINSSCGGLCINSINGALYLTLAWASAPTYTSTCGAGQGNCGSNNGPTTAATAASTLTCYDNGGVAGVEKYSMGQNQGARANCGLSFRFQ